MKKLWKKLVAVTTAVMMAITLLPAMANAASTIDYNQKGSITINKTTNVKKQGTDNEYEALEGAEFTLYKIAELTSAGYNMLVTDVSGYTTPDSLLNLSKDEQKMVASKFANSAQTKKNKIDTKVTDSNGQAKFTDLGLGYYLVVETNAPEGYVASVPFFVAVPTSNTADTSNKDPENAQADSWVYDITASPKNESVSIDKKIVEGEARKDATQAGVGDTVTYEITSISPKYTQEYFTEGGADKDPAYVIHDTLSVGLTYNKDLKVTVDGVELTNTDGEDYAITENTDRGFSIAFTKKFLQTENYKGKSVKVTYTATVNKDAVVGTDGNTNTVTLDYNRTPGSDTTSATGTTIPKVYTYGLKLTKKDAKNNNTVLQGAEFKIYKVVDGKEIQIKDLDGMTDGIYTTSSEGKITIKGLNAGTYRLEEVKAPTGYTLLKDKIEFTITGAENVNGTVTTTTNGFYVDEEVGYVNTNITNNKGFNLPSTGGMGTYLFTIAGLVIMAGAAFLLIASERRRA